MWLPETYAEIADACAKRSRAENTYTEFKSRESSRKEQIGIGLAALAHYGGVLLIGVEQDKETHKTASITPVNLRDVTERVANLASNVIDPALQFRCTALDDGGGVEGVLVVEVFAHPLAPVMFDGRHYSRNE